MIPGFDSPASLLERYLRERSRRRRELIGLVFLSLSVAIIVFIFGMLVTDREKLAVLLQLLGANS